MRIIGLLGLTAVLAFAPLHFVNAAPAQAQIAPALSNQDIADLVERRVPPDKIIAQINASAGAYVFGGIDELRVKTELSRTMNMTYLNAMDQIIAAMYAKMNLTGEAAAREKKLPIQTAALDPLSGKLPLGGGFDWGKISELKGKKYVFAWSNDSATRDWLIKALQKDGRFIPVYDARLADFIMELDASRRTQSRQTQSGGTYELCAGDFCSDVAYGPSYEKVKVQSASLNVFRYAASGQKAPPCGVPDPLGCIDLRGLEYVKRLVFATETQKQGFSVKRTNPVDAVFGEFLTRYERMIANSAGG